MGEAKEAEEVGEEVEAEELRCERLVFAFTKVWPPRYLSAMLLAVLALPGHHVTSTRRLRFCCSWSNM